MVRTARLVAQWQCVGFCHGVLNTDNMSILGLTLDYGPYGFMDRSDTIIDRSFIRSVWLFSVKSKEPNYLFIFMKSLITLEKTSLCFLRFDPDFVCNASDNSRRYSYQAQPAICRWNLVKLAEALTPELPPDRAEAVMDEYLHLYNGFYLENMRKKLGLLKTDEPEDEILITELLQTMHNTGGMRVGGHIA